MSNRIAFKRLENMLHGIIELGDKLRFSDISCPVTVDHVNSKRQTIRYGKGTGCALCKSNRDNGYKFKRRNPGEQEILDSRDKALHTMEELEYQRELRRIENE